MLLAASVMWTMSPTRWVPLASSVYDIEPADGNERSGIGRISASEMSRSQGKRRIRPSAMKNDVPALLANPEDLTGASALGPPLPDQRTSPQLIRLFLCSIELVVECLMT